MALRWHENRASGLKMNDMISKIDNLPSNMVGFKARGEITEKDFTDLVMPAVQELVNRTGKINYLLVLETPLKNFSAGAWLKDAVMGIKHLLKWNRAAIVTDTESIRTFTDLFGIVIPGEFRGFEHNDLKAAIDWTAEKRLWPPAK